MSRTAKAETSGNDHIALSYLNLREKGGDVSCLFRKITDQANLKSLQDYKQCWERLTSCLAVGWDCSHICCKFIASEPVYFVLCSCSSEGQAAVFRAGALFHWKSNPRLLCYLQTLEAEGLNGHKTARRLNIKHCGYFDEVVSSDKRCRSMPEGGFQNNWNREIPTRLVLTACERKKAWILVKRLLAIAVNSYCRSFTSNYSFNWTNIKFEFIFAVLLQPTTPSHYFGRIKGTSQERGEHGGLQQPQAQNNTEYSVGNKLFQNPQVHFPRCEF